VRREERRGYTGTGDYLVFFPHILHSIHNSREAKKKE